MTKGKSGVCKMCGSYAKLVRAHIIPESFYRPMFEEHGYARLVTNADGEYDRSLPTGVYDPELLCLKCEKNLSPYDSYAKEFFLDADWDSLLAIDEGSTRVYVVERYDYGRLKMFLMTVLWRIAATSRKEFSQVDIGPHLAHLTQAIRKANTGSVDEWTVLMGRFSGPPGSHPDLDPRRCWLDPHCHRLGRSRINCVKIYLAEFIIYVKVDSRPWKGSFDILRLQPGKPLFVIARDFASSRELEVMARMVRGRH